MKLSEAKQKAILKYRKDKTKQVSIYFYPSDMELYDYIAGKENKTAYLKDLIRRDMEGK